MSAAATAGEGPAAAAPDPVRVRRACLIGLGLIGSSIARSLKHHGLAETVVGHDADPAHLSRAEALGFLDVAEGDVAAAVAGADLVVLCVPVGALQPVMRGIAPVLAPGTVLTDVGSTKGSAVRDIAPLVPPEVHFVPGHPIAGTEHSGPDAGFVELFQGRYCILTPLPDTDPAAVARVRRLWEAMGSTIEVMSVEHHDQVLAITSHLPHLIAYTIVGTAADLEDHLKQEVIRFSASGFRDFTRIAASDPIMWRDVFMNNREAVLEILQRFTEDLTALQRSIRWGEADKLEDLFRRTRDIRRGIIEANQA